MSRRRQKPWVAIAPGTVDCIYQGTMIVTGGDCFVKHADRAHVECAEATARSLARLAAESGES